jgi:signal peptidase II
VLYKYRLPIIIAFLVLFFDQALKFYIKLNFYHGEEYEVFGEAFKLYFVENEGMAFGWKLDGVYGKIILTTFRIAAVCFIGYYLYVLTNKKAARGLIVSISLILAGALGNIIDSVFYGVIFSASSHTTTELAQLFPAEGGYAPWLHGKVVDMLSFNLFTVNIPHAIPFLGGKSFTFFGPIFNIADAAITGGVILILIFQKRFFKEDEELDGEIVETSPVI